MEPQKYWLKFIISGKPQDYLNYIDSIKKNGEAVNGNSLFNRRIGDKGEQYRG